jgi:glycosyltransferase involved in cell wall biosynthesis
MKITVILCTYNRCRKLPKAMESVLATESSALFDWELLVVDNNSKDETRQVVEEFARRSDGRVRYVFEPRQGKSFALNRGIQEASGEIIAFVDDDVLVEQTWLRSLIAPLESDDACVGTGGRILPLWDAPMPAWLPPEGGPIMAPLVSFDPNQGEGSLLVEPPFGTNMAFRREMFAKHGGFRTDLGPRPGSEIRSEDTEFGQRLLDTGEAIRYVPSAIVYHPVSPERLTKKYFLHWFFDKGRAEVIVDSGKSDGRYYRILGVPARLFGRVAIGSAGWMITFSPYKRFDRKRQLWVLFGAIAQYFLMRSAANKITAVPRCEDSGTRKTAAPCTRVQSE